MRLNPNFRFKYKRWKFRFIKLNQNSDSVIVHKYHPLWVSTPQKYIFILSKLTLSWPGDWKLHLQPCGRAIKLNVIYLLMYMYLISLFRYCGTHFFYYCLYIYWIIFVNFMVRFAEIRAFMILCIYFISCSIHTCN